ncbi:putative epoxide hydrolase protein [Botrytis fragariae]|uniref:Putative epoxide hydrolase protein n=1 Tax=Botrytis fragariae TaxID=1964551 RepID=A0A8H6AWX1_9HELO|nr:putative epoxide hydrolase protein [Botrytis fragariae]KAF5875214.1 putative epoxide hydrolase protein [Botrytis fragariae]
MSQEDYPIDFVLESIETIMTSENQPKVILFDIGGVCVLSPMQAILDFEISNNIPPGWVNYALSKNKPNGFWHRLERGELELNSTFFTGFTSDLHNPSFWTSFYNSVREKHSLPSTVPHIPRIDGEALFWSMMDNSRELDPWMYPCLQKLKASKKYTLAGLSNTVIFPPSHPYSKSHSFIPEIFDVFISSAHVHMRKPSPEIYALTFRTLREHHSSKFPNSPPLSPSDILFLDDIGENLKAAKTAGFRTLKVNLGRAYEAVEELERITGLGLSGDHPKVPIGLAVKGKARDVKL